MLDGSSTDEVPGRKDWACQSTLSAFHKHSQRTLRQQRTAACGRQVGMLLARALVETNHLSTSSNGIMFKFSYMLVRPVPPKTSTPAFNYFLTLHGLACDVRVLIVRQAIAVRPPIGYRAKPSMHMQHMKHMKPSMQWTCARTLHFTGVLVQNIDVLVTVCDTVYCIT
jgi:hypothetical protein